MFAKTFWGTIIKSENPNRSEEMEFPKQAFAVIPISDVFERVSSKLSELLGELKNHGAKGKPSNLPSCYLIAMAQGAPSLS